MNDREMEQQKNADEAVKPVKSNGKWATKTDSAAGTAAQLPEQAAQIARGYYENIKGSASEALETVNRRASSVVRQYPMQSAAAALAIGFLFGALMGRRKA